jgi:hypothetical protein
MKLLIRSVAAVALALSAAACTNVLPTIPAPEAGTAECGQGLNGGGTR